MKNFPGSVAAMLVGSSARREAYIQYEADFFGFDPVRFPALFKDDWRASITASYAVESDEARDDVQEVLTDRVLALMADGRRMYIDLKYWVNRAFPNDRGIRNYFGIDTYSDVSQSQQGMIVQLSEMHRGATHATYGPLLLAAGYTAAKVTALGTLLNDLVNENATQDNFIGDSPVATTAREAQYNSTYAFDQAVNEASKVIYYGNPVMLNRFTLTASGNASDVFNVLGTMTDSVTGLPIAGGKVKLVELDILVLTDEFGKYGLTEIPAGNYTLQFAADGYAVQSVNITVPASGAVTQDVAMVPAP